MSEFWMRKIKTFFTRLDLNCDGVLTEEDYVTFGKRLADRNNADSAGRDKLVQHCQDMWKVWTKAATGDDKLKMTAPEFIEAYRKHNHDLDFKSVSIDLIGQFFKLMDLNQDGYLDEEELRCFYLSLGMEDVNEWMKCSFNALDLNGDHKISVGECISGYLEYVTTDDINHPYNMMFGPLVDL